MSESPSLTDEQTGFVQEVGLFMEQSGLTPVAGQLVGWLMISDPPYQSANQLRDVLQVAKSTISTTLRQLIAIGFIEKFRLHGDRTDYYRYNLAFMENSLKRRAEGLRPFADLYQKALDMNNADSDRARLFQQLLEMTDFYIKKYAEIDKEWIQIKKERWG